MNIIKLVDDFVLAVNARPSELLPVDEVPEFLRGDVSGLEGYTAWRIVKTDNAGRIETLEERLKKRFPPSFRYFISQYSFPAFESGPLLFFANTGRDLDAELSKRLFHDPAMSPALLKEGFLQIGNPSTGGYDPVCFDLNSSRSEHPLVRLDHEAILQGGKFKVIKELAPSFLDFINIE